MGLEDQAWIIVYYLIYWNLNYTKTRLYSCFRLTEMKVDFMKEKRITEEDFFKVTWEDFDKYAKKISYDVYSFCRSKNIIIDFICPVVRGGSVLATYLSHLLGIIPCFGLQLKHLNKSSDYESPRLLWENFSYLCPKKRSEKEYVVLLVEGNHVSGGTSIKACQILKQYFPKIKIIYATLARDFKHKNIIDDFEYVIFSTTGFYSNESKANYSNDFMANYKIVNKNPVFPWETIQEEVNECNNVEVQIKTTLFD